MTNTLLRLPDEIYEKLKKIAKREERSVNAQIVYIIKKYVEEYFSSLDS
ncbi:MAG: ribbon-helix-helix domain-containing protein [Anaerolineales bacterium]